jgi:iron complex transport system substrate-binding protein
MNLNVTGPRRIVCLTEETTETLYLLGEQDRIVGVSGFTVRPPEAREKPRISAFTSAKTEKILELKPDLVLGFSDLQAGIAKDLIAAGLNVMVFNQRSIAEILEMMLMLARIVNASSRGVELVSSLERELNRIADSSTQLSPRPRVFFEEWMDPLISGIRWIEELIEVAGGTPVYPELRYQQDARNRIVQPSDVVARNPDVVIASWCGRKVNKQAIRGREGWAAVNAVRDGNIFEIKSTYILQPGPAALTEGIRQLHTIICCVCGFVPGSDLAPREATDPDLRTRMNMAGVPEGNTP